MPISFIGGGGHDGANSTPLWESSALRYGLDVIHLNLHCKPSPLPHGAEARQRARWAARSFWPPSRPGLIPPLGRGFDLEEDRPQSVESKGSFTAISCGGQDVGLYSPLGARDLWRQRRRSTQPPNRLAKDYDLPDPPCMHEFVLGLSCLKKETARHGCGQGHVGLRHASPTMYFPSLCRRP